MECKNCGTKIKKDTYCIRCGTYNEENPNSQTPGQPYNQQQGQPNGQPETYQGNYQQQGVYQGQQPFAPIPQKDDGSRIYLIVFWVSFILSIVGVPFAWLVSMITIITAKVKFPNNKSVTASFWFFIILMILALIAMFLFIMACASACDNMQGMY